MTEGTRTTHLTYMYHRTMPPKAKTSIPDRRKHKQASSAASAKSAAAGEGGNLATSRPRREPKAAYDPLREEEDAQLELAIRLSLRAQKAQKKKKAESVESVISTADDCDKKGKSLSKPSSVNDKKLQDNHQPEPKTAENPQKKRPRPRPTTSKLPAKKAKVEKLAMETPLKKEAIPSTASFISYVLQKGSSNRDLSLVKQFERKEMPRDTLSAATTNTATESESECDTT